MTIQHLIAAAILPLVLVSGVGCLHPKDNADKSVAALTDPADALDRDVPFVPRDRPDQVIYSARSEGESQTKVFVQSARSSKPRVIYVDAEPGELVDVSSDGTSGVFERFVSPGKSDYVVVDFARHAS